MATQQAQYGPPMIPSGSRVVVVVSDGPHPVPPTAFVQVPPVTGKHQGDALSALQDIGLQAQVFNDYSDTVKRGEVIGQLPAAGASTPAGSEAVLIVSSGKAPAPTTPAVLPEVAGKTEQEAVSQLQQAGFSPQVVREHSPSAAEGIVIGQLPSARSLAAAPPKSNAWIMWAAIAAAVVVLGLLAFFLLRGGGGKVTVPDVVGMPQDEAVKVLEDAGLEVKVTEDEDAEGEPGTVTEQKPPAGTEVNEGDEEEIIVVPETTLVEVPDVRKMNQADATKELQDAGLVVSVTRQPSQSVDKGLVISQSPAAGQQVPPGTNVGVVISDGPEVKNVDVPDVVGMKRADAQQALIDAGLKVVIAESSSDSVAKDVVINQLPGAGESVAPGTTVGIVVSTGPAPAAEEVQVPDVVGLTLAEAQQTVSDAGLDAIPVPYAGSGKPANEVVAQSPESGEKVVKGSNVALYYSNGQ